MFRTLFRPSVQAPGSVSSLLTLVLIGSNLVFNIIANASFKISAASSTWRNLLFWQIIGNMAGLVTVITLTWLLRYIPLKIAFPVTTGLTVIGVQVVAAAYYFGESISSVQWLGTLLIVVGITLISGR